jgi:putative membrane protein
LEATVYDWPVSFPMTGREMIRGMRIGVRVAAAVVLTAAATGAAASASVAAAPAPERAWLVAAHQSNLAEIAAGKDAQKNATNADVKMIGEHLVADHTTLDASVSKLAQKYDVVLPSAPNAEQRAALASVQRKSGGAYDAAWVTTQLTGHRKTKSATQTYLSTGSAADVLAAARAATPVVQRHIDELTSVAGDLGVPTSVNGGTGGQSATGGHGGALAASLTAAGLIMLGAAAFTLRRRRAPVA